MDSEKIESSKRVLIRQDRSLGTLAAYPLDSSGSRQTLGRAISRLDSPLVVCLIVALVYAGFLALLLARYGFDPSCFVRAGDVYSEPSLVPPGLTVSSQSSGYDGQFYYRLALNPLSTRSVEYGITLDSPAYRDQRLLYPLIVWVVSLGRSSLVPPMLIAVNYASLCLIAFLSARCVRALGHHSLWGLTIPLYPGFLFTIARDLTEIVEIYFLLAGVWLLCTKKDLLASLSLSGAVFARETAVVFVAATVVERVVEGRRKPALSRRGPRQYYRYLLLFLPLVVFVCWQLSLLYRWGMLPFSEGQGNLGPPLVGLVGYVVSSVLPALGSQRLWIVEISFVVAVTACAAWSARNAVVPLSYRLSWIMYALLASTLTGLVWNDDWAFFRVLSELHVLGALAIVRSPFRLKFVVLIATSAIWLYLARQVVLRDACA